jgi:hypothetical protein
MLLRKVLTGGFLFSLLYCNLNAQIFAPSASDSFNVNYNQATGKDQVYVFNRPEFKAAINASLIASSVDREAGWTFQWAIFSHADSAYHNLPGTSTGAFSYIDTITVSSGYRVEASKGPEKDTFRVWVLINDLNVIITNKDAENKLKFGYYKCASLDLHSDTTRISLLYYNPFSGARVNVPNSYKIRWTTDNPEASNPPSSLISRVNNPPYADTWYKLTVTDLYGISRSDSVFYETIQTKASLIKPEYISLDDAVEYPGKNYGDFYNDDILSAPGKYRFDLSGSKNLLTYMFLFGDGDTLISSVDDTLVVVHEYQKPGVYKVILTTRSEENCTDSVSVTAELKSAIGSGPFKNFSLPNVFTPNADNRNDRLVVDENVDGSGGNDVFRSEDVSVLVIDISIFDRAGHKVHSYAGSIREWEGWNGLIRDSNRQAPEGVYFYVITLLDAYNDKEYPIGEKVKRGFFHLYRE